MDSIRFARRRRRVFAFFFHSSPASGSEANETKRAPSTEGDKKKARAGSQDQSANGDSNDCTRSGGYPSRP